MSHLGSNSITMSMAHGYHQQGGRLTGLITRSKKSALFGTRHDGYGGHDDS